MASRPSKGKHLVVGMGEIGQALHAVFSLKSRSYEVIGVDLEAPVVENVYMMHVAFPYSENFVEQVKAYQEKYNPDITVVYSTVPIGTTDLIGGNVAHSPVEGRHPDLAKSILAFPRWIGCSDEAIAQMVSNLWWPIVSMVRVMKDPRHTEWLKLRSTSKYGASLVWAEYEKQVSDELGMDFKANKDFDFDYNRLYTILGFPQFQRYLLDPPEGKIGGHCVVPNAKILDEQYPNPILGMIKDMEVTS